MTELTQRELDNLWKELIELMHVEADCKGEKGCPICQRPMVESAVKVLRRFRAQSPRSYERIVGEELK